MTARRTQLRLALEDFGPRDRLEAEYRRSMLRLLDGASDPFGRDHFDPGHFTASTFVLSPDGGSLLLIFHSKLERWLQPGGHVDPDDVDIVAAARREVEEETGISGLLGDGQIFDLDVHAIAARKNEPEHSHFDIRFVFRSPNIAYNAGSDASDARWVPLSEVRLVESDESVMRAVRKLRV